MKVYFASMEIPGNATPSRTGLVCVRFHRPGKWIYLRWRTGEFGYFSPDVSGTLQYHSLNALIPPSERDYGDVWDIVHFQDAYFFRTADRVFRIAGQQCTIYRPAGFLEHLEAVQGQLLLHSASGGLLRFDGSQFVRLCEGPSSVVTAMLPWRGDTVLIATLKHGLFSLTSKQLIPWNTPAG